LKLCFAREPVPFFGRSASAAVGCFSFTW
jgi:hypothetical protein